MPKITFIELNGAQHSVEVQAGISLMEAARNNNIRGIEAECGGACACATCHVYVERDWLEVTGPARGVELDLLEYTGNRGEGSRLSCQIGITNEMDGLIVRLPEVQE
jgi:2Fe-2S ferredoxin